MPGGAADYITLTPLPVVLRNLKEKLVKNYVPVKIGFFISTTRCSCYILCSENICNYLCIRYRSTARGNRHYIDIQFIIFLKRTVLLDVENRTKLLRFIHTRNCAQSKIRHKLEEGYEQVTVLQIKKNPKG